jgi:hypothetical protein
MTKQLMTWARSMNGMGNRSGKAEFSSQQALQSYLRQHPAADASKHSVKQQSTQSTQSEESSSNKRAEQAEIDRRAKHAAIVEHERKTMANTTELPSGVRVKNTRASDDIGTKQAKADGARLGDITAASAKSFETSGARYAETGHVGMAARDYYAAAMRHGADGRMGAAKKALKIYNELAAHARANPLPPKS